MRNIYLFYPLFLSFGYARRFEVHATPWLYQSLKGREQINLRKIVHLKPKAQTISPPPSSFPYVANCALLIWTPPRYSITLEAWRFPDALLHNDENIITPLTSSKQAFHYSILQVEKTDCLVSAWPESSSCIQDMVTNDLCKSDETWSYFFSFAVLGIVKTEQQIERVYYRLSYCLFDKVISQ